MRFEVSRWRKLLNHGLTRGMLLVIAIAGGCNDQTVVVPPEERGILPPANPSKIVAKPQIVEAFTPGKKDWLNVEALPPPRWYSLYLNGKCIGYSQYSIAPTVVKGDLLRLTKRDVFEVTTSQTGPVQRREIVLESLEDPNGLLRSYSETSDTDGSFTKTDAKQEGGVLNITKTELGKIELGKIADGKQTSKNLSWPADAWGPLGTIAILQSPPMQPDESREAKVFVPALEKIVRIELKSKKREPATLPGSLVQELLLVETRFINDEEITVTKNWVNDSGEIVKSVSPGGFTMFQSTREEAERIDSSIRAARLIDTKIPIQATVEQLRSASVTFAIDSTEDDPFGFLSSKVNQEVKSLSTRGATLTIHRAIPLSPIPEGVPQDTPDEACLVKFSSDSELLLKFLSEFPDVSSEDTLTKASKLTAGIFQKLEKTAILRNFSTPGQVIKRLNGDCKSHSILLIAALRERGIPARAASGLRIVQEKNNNQLVAIYHMWCEAWVGDRWMPLDPFAGTIGVGADHIKFSEAALNEDSQMTMMDVLQHMKYLTIAIKQ